MGDPPLRLRKRIAKGAGKACVRSVLLDAGARIALFAVNSRRHTHFDRLVTELTGAGLGC